MADDLDAPSWWNRLFPDYAAYEDALEAVLPALVPIGPVPVPRDVVILGGWFTPFGQSGLYTRLALWASETGKSLSELQLLWSVVQDQASSAGFGAGPGVGGSFGWKAGKDMAALVIPNVYRVAVEGSSGGQPVTNVVGVRGSGSGLSLQAAQAVQTAWKVATGPLSVLPSSYALLGFRALDLSSLNGAIADVSDTTAGGSSGGIKSTNAACALVKWNGGTRSRSSRGRLYFGPLLEAQIQADGRTLETASRTAIQTAFTAFRTSLSSSGFTLCVISPTTSSAFDVASVAVESIIATQRRRIRG